MRILLAAILSLALSGPALSQSPGVVVRTKLDPATGVVVGESVNLLVDVLFPDAMPRPPRVSVPDAPGVQILRFESQGVTMRERLSDRDYVGQRFAFVAFPRRGGALLLPAAEVTLLDPAGEVAGAAKGETVRIEVAVPPRIDASGPVIASTHVTASESFAPAPSAPLRPGDAIVRTITREAADVPALGMLDFTFAAPDGVRVYVDPPSSEDRVNRGTVTGHRTDKATYVFERAGSFTLPALSQPWIDLATKSARSEALPGATVTVVAAPTATTHAPEAAARSRMPEWLAGAALAAALVFLAWWAWPKIRTAARDWKSRRAASEDAARRELRRVARTGEPARTYRCLRAWLARLSPPDAEEVRRDAALKDVASRLERALFGTGGEPWTGDLGHRLAAVVSSLPSRRVNPHRASALPPLNPAGSP
jgi:hypothetical protein